MADPTLKIIVDHVYFSPTGRGTGTGRAKINASIIDDGGTTTAFGDPAKVYNYNADHRASCKWSKKVNVKGKNSLTLKVEVKDTGGTVLATFTHTMRPVWHTFRHKVLQTNNANLVFGVLPEGIKQRTASPYAISTSRNASGAVEYTTVAGSSNSFRFEVCPVHPVPDDMQLPRRPVTISQALFLSMLPPWRSGLSSDIRQNDPINVLPNPTVIPILKAPPGKKKKRSARALDYAATANRRNCARLECTFYFPITEKFSDNDKRLEWKKISGAGEVKFYPYEGRGKKNAAHKGMKVMAYGTTAGEIVLGVYFNGTLVTRYRALVQPVKKLLCRFNIFNGPRGPAGDRKRFTPISGPEHVYKHREIANRFLNQMGVVLYPDTNKTTTWANGRTVTKTKRAGIFRISVQGPETRNVSDNDSETLIRYNSRAGVLNFFYIKSHTSPTTGGAAVYWPDSKLGHPAGYVNDSGSPSSSWISPSGLKPDNAAATVKIRYIRGWPPPAAPAAYAKLYGMFITNAMGAKPNGADAIGYGNAIAHEVGHMLNLGHRVETITDATLRGQWNAGTLGPAAGAKGRIPALVQGGGKLGANDGTWCDELWHPRQENMMRWINFPYINQNFDILQSLVVRNSPLLS